MQPSKQLMQVLSKKKSIKDFQPKRKKLPLGGYEVVDPGRLVRIGNRQLQFVRGGTWLWGESNIHTYMINIRSMQIESGIRITQFNNNDGTIDYIHFLTNSEYETQQTLRIENETHICSFDCSCNSDLAQYWRNYLCLKRDNVELYTGKNRARYFGNTKKNLGFQKNTEIQPNNDPYYWRIG